MVVRKAQIRLPDKWCSIDERANELRTHKNPSHSNHMATKNLIITSPSRPSNDFSCIFSAILNKYLQNWYPGRMNLQPFP